MKIRAVLKSLLFSYALTGVSLLLLAFLLFTFDLGETAVDAGIIVVYVFACFMGGFMAGRMVLFSSTCSIFCRKGKMGHECGPCSDDFFYVSGRWHTWRNVVVKKDFQNEKIYGILCQEYNYIRRIE